MKIPHGLLLIDKPSGITSHDVVSKVKRALNTSNVGHAGTLDPIASGLMVVLVGEATKLSQYILDEDKGYDVSVRFGVTTDTLDRSGQVLTQQKYEIDFNQLQSTAHELQGDLDLKIPMYSAKKIDGQKLYELARKNIQIEQPKKIMNFYNIQMHTMDLATMPYVRFTVYCKKGGFIRAWVDELGQRLEVGAIVQELRRIYSAPFKIDQAITLAQLASYPELKSGLPYFIQLENSLPHWYQHELDGFYLKLLDNGQIAHDLAQELEQLYIGGPNSQLFQGVKFIDKSTQQLKAIAQFEPDSQDSKKIKLKRVFRY